jgi:ribonuclease HII
MNSHITGVDEVGRGSLVGSLVVCAFRSKNELFEKLPFSVKDSKKITKKNRELIYDFFKKNKNEDFNYSIVIGKKREIEDLNIHHAVLLAMKKAIFKLNALEDEIIIDGKFTPSDISKYNIRAVIKADDKYPQVSAASIIAKCFRDRLLEKLHRIEKFYRWDKNAGYATKSHLDAIKIYGVSKFHRRTYQPITQIINKLST